MTTTVQGPPPREPWVEKQVLAEAVAFGNRFATDFRLSIDVALRHAPNPKDQVQRSLLINEFFNVLPDVAAKIVADFGNPAPETEEVFVQIVRARFAAQRNAAELKTNSKPVSVKP